MSQDALQVRYLIIEKIREKPELTELQAALEVKEELDYANLIHYCVKDHGGYTKPESFYQMLDRAIAELTRRSEEAKKLHG
jgi:hypothetical protein